MSFSPRLCGVANGLFTTIIYRNVRHLAAFAIHDSDMASDASWGVFRNLLRDGFGLLTRFLIAWAIYASGIHKAVAVHHIKKVTRHGLNLLQFPR